MGLHAMLMQSARNMCVYVISVAHAHNGVANAGSHPLHVILLASEPCLFMAGVKR